MLIELATTCAAIAWAYRCRKRHPEATGRDALARLAVALAPAGAFLSVMLGSQDAFPALVAAGGALVGVVVSGALSANND